MNARRKKNKHFWCKCGSYFVDLISSITLLAVALVEKLTPAFQGFSSRCSADLVVTLLPGIITIVSISLSWKKEKQYGLTTIEINGLRSSWAFSFLHMVVVMSVFVALYTIFSVINVHFTILALDILAFFYALYFSFQEIPLLIGNKKYFAWIIRRSYLNNRTDLYFNDQSLILKAFQNLTLTEDISQAYTLLSCNNPKYIEGNHVIINELLDSQNAFFFASLDEIEIIRSNLSSEFKGLQIIDAIEKGYANIKILLTGDNWYTLDEITGSTNKTYQLTRTTFALHKITSQLSLEKFERKNLNAITGALCFNNQNIRVFPGLQKYVFTMCVSTLKDGESWFMDSLLNNDYSPHYFFRLDNSGLGLFLSIYLAHITSKSNGYLDGEKISRLIAFMNKKSNGLNSDGSTWMSLLKWEFFYENPERFVNSLCELMKLYDSVDEPTFYPVKAKCVMYDASHNFSKENVIDAWLQIVLFSYADISAVDNQFIESTIVNLTADDKEILFSVLSRKYIRNNMLNENISTDFLDTFRIGVGSKTIGWRNSNVWKCLLNARNNAVMQKIDAAIEQNQCDYQKIIMSKLISAFEKVRNENLFLSDTLTFENTGLKYFSYLLDMIDLAKITDACMDRVPDMFNIMISNAIKRCTNSIIYEDKNVELIYDTIKKFDADSRMELSDAYYHLNPDQQKELSYIKPVRNTHIPCDLYWKDGAIKFNCELDQNETIIRKLNDDEVEKIISNRYQESTTGLYYYSLHENDVENGIWITRNELRTKIKDRNVLLIAVFKYNIMIDNKKCLVFERKSTASTNGEE